MSDYDSFARYYELFDGQFAEDLPVYVNFAQRSGGPVLELGCGTGRVALALAREGLAVTGLDRSAAMLALARRKLEQAGLSKSVTLIEADLGDFELGPAQRFRLAVCAQNTFCHMLTTADQIRLLRAAHRHLDKDGLLVVDVYNPDPAALLGNDMRLLLTGMTTDPATGHIITRTMARAIDAGEQIEHVTLFVDEIDDHQATSRHLFDFDLRYVYRFELELLLDKAGFKVEAVYGSYQLEPFCGESERLLAVARRQGRANRQANASCGVAGNVK